MKKTKKSQGSGPEVRQRVKGGPESRPTTTSRSSVHAKPTPKNKDLPAKTSAVKGGKILLNDNLSLVRAAKPAPKKTRPAVAQGRHGREKDGVISATLGQPSVQTGGCDGIEETGEEGEGSGTEVGNVKGGAALEAALNDNMTSSAARSRRRRRETCRRARKSRAARRRSSFVERQPRSTSEQLEDAMARRHRRRRRRICPRSPATSKAGRRERNDKHDARPRRETDAEEEGPAGAEGRQGWQDEVRRLSGPSLRRRERFWCRDGGGRSSCRGRSAPRSGTQSGGVRPSTCSPP